MIYPNRMKIKFEGQYFNEHYTYESYRSVETLKRHRFTLSKIFQRRNERFMYKYPCFTFQTGEEVRAENKIIAEKSGASSWWYPEDEVVECEPFEWTAEMQAEVDREILHENKLREIGIFTTDTAFIFGENQLGNI